MRLLDSDKIIGLSVSTKNGQFLGKVSSFEIDADSQSIFHYKIKLKGIIDGLFKGQLLISRNQVISISKKEMIVADNVVSEEAKEKIRALEQKLVSKEAGAIQSKMNNK